jgi:non-specific serine/threonine protein kinase
VLVDQTPAEVPGAAEDAGPRSQLEGPVRVADSWPADSTDPTLFREKVHAYRRPTGQLQKALADRVGVEPHVLSRKLHGVGGARLTHQDVKRIIGALAEWEAITHRTQAVELLALMGLRPGAFTAEEWNAPPLNRLETVSPPSDQTPHHATAPADQADVAGTAQARTGAGAQVARRGNSLPLQITSFVGRERELVETAELLAATRLLTLTGTGGCGKTRLALALASQVQADFADGVWLVELAPFADPALVPRAVASVLGVRELHDRPLIGTLIDALRARHLLLLLDNCEHVVDGAALVAKAIVHACPHVTTLATSREALGITGEAVYPVPSLAVPDLSGPPAVDRLRDYGAVRLFCDRARAARPGFALSEQNAGAVAQICRQLDGIPLAIELAAARVKLLTAEQIASRLDDRFRLLTAGDRTALPRHRTLQGLIDWSYDFLPAEEQALFRRLAVFAGGFTLEAAEGVCAGGTIAEHAVLALLSQLVDKSLVLVDDQGGESRYRLLETIRQYGADRLAEAGEAEAVRNRHRDWYVGFVERTGAWSERLEIERDNLRAALERSLADEGGVEAGLRLAGALWWFWFAWGYLAEGRQWLEVMLSRAQASDRPSPALRAKALLGAGHLARFQGDWPSARFYSEQSLTLFEATGNGSGVGYALHSLAVLAQLEGDYGRATTLMEQSLALFRESQNQAGVRDVLWHLALVARVEGDYARARSLYEENLTLCRASGDRRGLAKVLVQLGLLALRIEGDSALAGALCGESLAISREIGDKPGMGYALARLGNLAWSAGDHARARTLYREGLERFREVMDRRQLATCLSFCGNLAVRGGSPARGAQLFGAAEALDPLYRTSLDPAERADCDASLAAARAALGDDAFAAAWADGRVMPLEQAIALATEDGSRLACPAA